MATAMSSCAEIAIEDWQHISKDTIEEYKLRVALGDDDEDAVKDAQGFKVGDRVSSVMEGSVGEILEVDDSDQPFRVSFDDGYGKWYKRHWIEAAGKPEHFDVNDDDEGPMSPTLSSISTCIGSTPDRASFCSLGESPESSDQYLALARRACRLACGLTASDSCPESSEHSCDVQQRECSKTTDSPVDSPPNTPLPLSMSDKTPSQLFTPSSPPTRHLLAPIDHPVIMTDTPCLVNDSQAAASEHQVIVTGNPRLVNDLQAGCQASSDSAALFEADAVKRSNKPGRVTISGKDDEQQMQLLLDFEAALGGTPALESVLAELSTLDLDSAAIVQESSGSEHERQHA